MPERRAHPRTAARTGPGGRRVRAWGWSNNRFIDKNGVIPPGTIFVHTRDGHPSTPSQPFSIGHTGFVIEDLGTQYRTIEGNASDSVRSNEIGRAHV